MVLANKSYPTTIFLTSIYCPLYNKVLRNISFPGFQYLDGGIFISTLLGETVTCRPGICSVFQTLFAFEGSEFHLEKCDRTQSWLLKTIDSIENECFEHYFTSFDFCRVSEISGKTFEEAARYFDEAQCIGILRDSEVRDLFLNHVTLDAKLALAWCRLSDLLSLIQFIFCPRGDIELQSGDTLVLFAESQSRCAWLVLQSSSLLAVVCLNLCLYIWWLSLREKGKEGGLKFLAPLLLDDYE